MTGLRFGLPQGGMKNESSQPPPLQSAQQHNNTKVTVKVLKTQVVIQKTKLVSNVQVYVSGPWVASCVSEVVEEVVPNVA